MHHSKQYQIDQIWKLGFWLCLMIISFCESQLVYVSTHNCMTYWQQYVKMCSSTDSDISYLSLSRASLSRLVNLTAPCRSGLYIYNQQPDTLI